MELKELAARCPFDLRSYVYDGDTEPELRRAIRDSGQVVITNPDMLHTGILPHHTKWIQLFQNLKFVVIDEVHHYRGVFGSHLANVIRRLKRICSFYGSRPQFILCSATIANPGELAETLIEEPVSVISKSGAPRGKSILLSTTRPWSTGNWESGGALSWSAGSWRRPLLKKESRPSSSPAAGWAWRCC